MSSQRQLKVAKLFQKEIADIFQKDSRHLFEGSFITISEVKVSPDLSIATVYISLMMAKNPQKILSILEDNNKIIRQQLSNRIKNQVRIIPHLRFFKDETLENAEKIEALLSKLNIPTENNSSDNKI